jgi:hypothetical protein
MKSFSMFATQETIKNMSSVVALSM